MFNFVILSYYVIIKCFFFEQNKAHGIVSKCLYECFICLMTLEYCGIMSFTVQVNNPSPISRLSDHGWRISQYFTVSVTSDNYDNFVNSLRSVDIEDRSS